MKDDWKPLNELVITPDINIIHVDTRDFHFTTSIMEVKPSNEVLIKEEEIIPFLEDLRNRSGGRIKWRLLRFEKYKDYSETWYKYLRFYRYDKDTWNLCDQYKTPFVNWKEITKHIKK